MDVLIGFLWIGFIITVALFIFNIAYTLFIAMVAMIVMAISKLMRWLSS